MRSMLSAGLSNRSQSWFTRLAKKTSWAVGRPVAFGAAVVLVVAWAVTGPLFKWSDTWQLVINTSTTIATFLMVFLIQNTQNRDAEAIQIKLDELIRVTRGAHTALLDLEELEDSELGRVRANYEELARKAREDLRKGKADTGSPEVKT
jgi:low affinity Fe/Cu permease